MLDKLTLIQQLVSVTAILLFVTWLYVRNIRNIHKKYIDFIRSERLKAEKNRTEEWEDLVFSRVKDLMHKNNKLYSNISLVTILLAICGGLYILFTTVELVYIIMGAVCLLVLFVIRSIIKYHETHAEAIKARHAERVAKRKAKEAKKAEKIADKQREKAEKEKVRNKKDKQNDHEKN